MPQDLSGEALQVLDESDWASGRLPATLSRPIRAEGPADPAGWFAPSWASLGQIAAARTEPRGPEASAREAAVTAAALEPAFAWALRGLSFDRDRIGPERHVTAALRGLLAEPEAPARPAAADGSEVAIASLRAELAATREELAVARTEMDLARGEVAALRTSTSWRVSAPLRVMGGLLKR